MRKLFFKLTSILNFYEFKQKQNNHFNKKNGCLKLIQKNKFKFFEEKYLH